MSTFQEALLTTTAFVPSVQQTDFYNWVDTGTGSAIVVAVAGAGKTTTLVNGLIRMNGSVFFGAFGYDIAQTILAKCEKMGILRNDLKISTTHAAGMAAWMSGHKNAKVVKGKVAMLIRQELEKPEFAQFKNVKSFVRKLVDFGKSFIMGVDAAAKPNRNIDNLKVWEKLMMHFSLDKTLPEPVNNTAYDYMPALKFVTHIYKLSLSMCDKIIDFSDMILAPLYYNVELKKYDWVIIDECQDINPARRELAKRMLKAGGRFVGVGDPHQSIFGFTGAGGNAIELLIKEFNATVLKLTVSYRCPKAVVAHARKFVDHIEAAPSAPEGKVEAITSTQDNIPWFVTAGITQEDAIICRYTAPLIATAFQMIRQGIPCIIKGKDLGGALVDQINRFTGVKTIDGLISKMDKDLEEVSAKADETDDETLRAAAQDNYDSIMIFVDKCRALRKNLITDVIAEIEKLFSDETNGVLTLCTGHKAKGLEFPRVYWLQAALRSKRDLKDWEVEQENNIDYVITTRAMAELYLVAESLHTPPRDDRKRAA